ncbi:hypothetical protein LQW54_012320 [Pestalotiopsis sp. IQ-011]
MADAKSIAPLPALLSEVTAEWLSSKLGHEVRSIENTRNIWGTASKLFYAITYAEDDGGASDKRPAHICIKGVFDPETIEKQPWTVSLAQREAEFFSQVAPQVKNMIFPKGWWAGISEKQGIAIMNDLTKEGCSFAAEVAAYPVEKVMNGVEQLAGIHAQYWGQSQKEHQCRPKLPEYLMDGKRCNEALDRYFSERNPRFRTLLHGDTHIGNIYFTAKGEIGFLDWSAFHFGSCFHDIVYHMTAMLSVEDRRAHEMEILDHYLDSLHRLGGPKFDRHGDPEVMIEYRRSFFTNVIWIICPDGLQSQERVAELCKRTVATFDDHEVIEVILDQPKPASTSSA